MKTKQTGTQKADGVTVGSWLSREEYDAVKKAADRESRSISQFLKLAALERAKNNGTIN